MPSIFDSHCHPQFPEYADDREEMIQRAIDEGVFMIAVGTSVGLSKAAIELADKYPKQIWAAVGIHPTETGGKMEELRDLTTLPEVVAIGETGLDYHYLKPGMNIGEIKNAQRRSFLEHIELAKAVKKPLIIHGRDAYDDILTILKKETGIGAVMHFFQGTAEEARKFLELGCYVSFAGPITFAEEYRQVVDCVPLDRILAETDAPYASPLPHRGKRNEPAYVKFVVQKIAEIKGITFEEASDAVSRNAQTLFRIN